MGQAAGRARVSIERVAINVDDSEAKDNDGIIKRDEAIFADGENAYFSTLPIKKMLKAVNEKGIPAAVSNTAGTYVCNHVFYSLMYYLNKDKKSARGGFIHLPCLPEQTLNNPNTPSMPLEMQAEAIKTCIETLEQQYK